MNRSFHGGIFPDIWKLANVIPIFRKGDKSEPSNYRPVALLSCIGKLQERIVFKNMYNFIIDNNLLYKYQSGFLPHHSTVFNSVTLGSNGQWHTHIENIVNSATKILGIVRNLIYSISRNALNQMYMSYMLPVVEYASVVWDGCSEQDSQSLQRIQNEAARMVTGLTRSVSWENLYK